MAELKNKQNGLEIGKNYHFYVESRTTEKVFHYEGEIRSFNGRLIEIYDFKYCDAVIISFDDLIQVRPSKRGVYCDR
jgi:hypothetical protein